MDIQKLISAPHVKERVALSYIVRRATPADASGIAAVARTTWAATYKDIIPEAIQSLALAQWYSLEGLTQSIANARGTFLVAATEARQIVGFANASPRRDPGEAELRRIYLLPEHQRQGLGRRLIHAALDALLAIHHTERLYVQVETANYIGRRAYEALGFTYTREYDDDFMGHVSRMSEMCLNVASE